MPNLTHCTPNMYFMSLYHGINCSIVTFYSYTYVFYIFYIRLCAHTNRHIRGALVRHIPPTTFPQQRPPRTTHHPCHPAGLRLHRFAGNHRLVYRHSLAGCPAAYKLLSVALGEQVILLWQICLIVVLYCVPIVLMGFAHTQKAFVLYANPISGKEGKSR